MKFNFHIGKKSPTIKQWVAYSIGTATTVSLIVHFGNELLKSRHGEFVRDVICSVSKVVPEGNVSRLLSAMCQASKDGTITPPEAKVILGRGQQVSGIGSNFFDNDRENTDLRAEDEVSYAIEQWVKQNPSPKIDLRLRKQFPSLTEIQLCVLSQAKRYTDGDAIGIRYVGMKVCENDEVKPL